MAGYLDVFVDECRAALQAKCPGAEMEVEALGVGGRRLSATWKGERFACADVLDKPCDLERARESGRVTGDSFAREAMAYLVARVVSDGGFEVPDFVRDMDRWDFGKAVVHMTARLVCRIGRNDVETRTGFFRTLAISGSSCLTPEDLAEINAAAARHNPSLVST